MKPTYYDKSYKAAMSKENAAKNAVQNILPRKSQDISSLYVISDVTDLYISLVNMKLCFTTYIRAFMPTNSSSSRRIKFVSAKLIITSSQLS
jgi:hypothetical protein